MNAPYQNPHLPVEQRVEDLLGRMSTLEKVRQLNCRMGFGDDDMDPAEMGLEDGMGEMAVMGKDPVVLAQSIAKIQKYVREKTRLGIPVLFHCEALSGPVVVGSQILPTSITLGATYDPEIVSEMCDRTRKKMKTMGIRQALSPVVDIARDYRWGRISETYGGDPTLCAVMGTAFVKGLQGENLTEGVAATLKHFLGYSNTYGGLNMAKSLMDPWEMRETYAKPFEAAIRKGHACSVMNSYSEFNGQPICSSHEILHDLLRDDLGFDGLVVSDYMSVNRLVNVFHTAETPEEAGEQCLSAGLDVECPNPYGYNEKMAEDMDAGRADMEALNTAVRRVLTLKFKLGLFENPYPEQEKIPEVFEPEDGDRLAEKAAQEAMTLTKNDGLLPLKDRKLKLAVIGPMGNAPRAHYADYTWIGSVEMALGGSSGMAGVEQLSAASDANPLSQRGVPLHAVDQVIRQLCPKLKTTWEALKDRFESVTYTEGCDYLSEDRSGFAAAAEAAGQADVVIMTVGGRNGWGLFNTSGEGVDTVDVGLPGVQEELVRAVYAVNPRMIIAHTDSHPLVSSWIYEHVPAVIEGWLGGTFGGTAIAKTITGEINPGGRLQIDVPRSSAHVTMSHYLHNGTALESFSEKAINPDGYINSSASPQLSFGYGLSYTSFDYTNCTAQIDDHHRITVCADVLNTGDCAGDEVVQLYAKDLVGSRIRPWQELAGFKRIHLEPGQSKHVEFVLNLNQLAFPDREGCWRVEAGDFAVSLGKDSRNKVFEKIIREPESFAVDYTAREFYAECKVSE